MIKLIGLRRLVILCILQGFILIMAVAYFGGIMRMTADAMVELETMKRGVADLRAKIAATTQDIKFLEENMPRYLALEAGGFLADQDRFAITRAMGEMRDKTSWKNLPFSVGDTKNITVPAVDLVAVERKLMGSRIKVESLSSTLDTDVYVFLQEIGPVFSGHTRLQSFSIKRTEEVTRQSLVNMATGQNQAGYLSANIAFDWFTLSPATPAAAEVPK